MIWFWHVIVHGTGSDYTGRYGHIVPYSFWSGIAGSFLVGIAGFVLLWYTRHTCQASPWCFRIAKYQAAGGTFKVCRHHHPELKGQRPHPQLIEKLHREYVEALTFCGVDHGE